MGAKYEFICPKCSYAAEVCGGRDAGMLAVVETSICRSCTSLVDVIVADVGVMLGGVRPNFDPGEMHLCPRCSSPNVETWDTVIQPCPRCSTSMKNDGLRMLWD